MKLERWSCDKCKRLSNGDIGDWYVVATGNDRCLVFRMPKDGAMGKHACGEECAMSLVAEAMRGLPR